MTGFLMAFALRHPMLSNFIARWWKPIVGGLIVLAAVISFNIWKDNLKDAAFADGRAAAEKDFAAAVEAANRRELQAQTRLDKMVGAFGVLAAKREEQVNLTVRPIIERTKIDVSSDPRYAACAVTDGVLDNLNTGRATVDQEINASNPRQDRSGS